MEERFIEDTKGRDEEHKVAQERLRRTKERQ